MAECVIWAKGLTKEYGVLKALDNVDITVRRGEIYGLIGDNGAGKTTFLKILAGQAFLSGGELKLFDCHLQKDMEKQRKRTGAMIEASGFYPQLTIEKNLEYYRIQRGIPGKETVTRTLEMVGLINWRKKRCRELSMGMKQRLGLAIALLGEPEVLILDEPINGLDPSGILETRNLLLKLNREKRITIVLSSHILSELEQIATVYGFLKEGKLLEQITARHLKEKCARYIEIEVSDTERYTALLEKHLDHGQYQVMPDGGIRIWNPQKEIEAYSRLASDHNISITGLEKRQTALTDYYSSLKNGGQSGC